ncbi:hypothetical protein EVAR_82433_1 [Eumeta japonica]|uniref:Uncharacterized protein n=1 Tax=Eumeta variegata TaxID=151549 RepID=A0A4C1YL03_EUMVA|nr:hypothetical protein EVAR_82433_1 [Eumeta japonica]
MLAAVRGCSRATRRKTNITKQNQTADAGLSLRVTEPNVGRRVRAHAGHEKSRGHEDKLRNKVSYDDGADQIIIEEYCACHSITIVGFWGFCLKSWMIVLVTTMAPVDYNSNIP